ncbi:TRAP transporter large permease subunit [Bacteriovoracaceae bacterium]|nr:TRAP transporter large permease subunit [Bacteriovoracaceae bacterium]
MSGIGFAGIFILLLLFGQPLFLLLGSIAIYSYVFISEESPTIIIGDLFYAADKEVLLAIPLFVLAGQLMTKGKMANNLIDLAKLVTRKIPGGLAISAILSCSLFAAISGSSPVTLIAIGSILYPALKEANYPEKMSMGLLTSAGTLGIIIPPSIPMIVFAIMANVSVIDLFKAGIGPGFLLVAILIGYAVYRSPARSVLNFKVEEINSQSVFRGLWALFMPVIILGGIYTGFFSATESAVVAVAYAILVECIIFREIKWKEFYSSFVETGELLGSLFLILLLAVSINKFLSFEEIPQQISSYLTSVLTNKISFLLVVNLFLLIVGCFMDIMSAILVLAPLLTPAAVALGVDPIHFGIIMIVNLEIGYITPPIGINLFVATSIFKKNLGEVIKSVLPYVLLLLIGLILVTFVPQISLFLF